MIRKLFNAALIFSLALSVTVFAQQPSSTPSVDRLRQIVTYLAADALEGRRTGTQGAVDAANYIAGEFARFGLKPGMQVTRGARTRAEARSRYLQPFPYVAKVELGKNNLFFVNPGRADDIMQFTVREDWMPLGFSTNARLNSADAIFAGYGITDAGLNYNDYPAATNGKIALALSGTPDGDNPHGRFARYEDVRWKAVAAKNAGARALLIISRETNLNDDRLSRLRYDNNGEAGIPVAVMSRRAGIKLLGDNDVAKLTALETLFGQVVSEQLSKSANSYGLAALPEANIIPVAHYRMDFSTEVLRRESPSFNVIGILPGSDPRLKDETIVIGAHYDHLGLGGEGSLAAREGDIHHGADDNASGTAGVLELARMFTSQIPRPRRTIVFIAFSGEEEGLIGSNYYVNHPVAPLTNTVAMINMDMIGRLKDNKLIVGGIGTAKEWREWVDVANSLLETSAGNGAEGVLKRAVSKERFSLTLNEDGYGPSDHSSFYSKQVPVLFFWTGTHDDYHKPSDTADKINYEGEANIVSTIAKLIHDIGVREKRPTYTVAKVESQGRGGGFRVYLGTIPNYGDSNDGLKLDGVRDDSPAAKAGLKAGDRIVKLAGRDVKNVYDYTYALGEMKAGQEYEVELIRDGQRLTLRITPEARK